MIVLYLLASPTSSAFCCLLRVNTLNPSAGLPLPRVPSQPQPLSALEVYSSHESPEHCKFFLLLSWFPAAVAALPSVFWSQSALGGKPYKLDSLHHQQSVRDGWAPRYSCHPQNDLRWRSLVVFFIAHDGATTKKEVSFKSFPLQQYLGMFLPTTAFWHFPNLGSKKSQFTTACPFVMQP